MLEGERREGDLVVQLGPKLQAQPEELLRQRWSMDGQVEYLIRWGVNHIEEIRCGPSGHSIPVQSKSCNILMWMSAEEVYSNSPALLSKKKPEGPGVPEGKTSGAPNEGSLQEMTEDVRMLVQRATSQMSHSCGPDSSILNTIHVLSAYASICSLAGVFKETGALDLLMKMLCNSEKQIRKNAGKMLRALASHDAGSHAHVLLSLSQQDGIELHMDFESRFTLLQLFAETTNPEEHCISFDGIQLPQIPGKQLFSLVKRYLCVTSLLDQLSSDRPDCNERICLQRQFDFCMAMGSFICELMRDMGWKMEGLQSVSHDGAHVQQHQGSERVVEPETLELSGVETTLGGETISQGDWWELLFFIRQLDNEDKEKVLEVVGKNVEKQDFLDLLQMTVTTSAAQKMVWFLCDHCKGHLLCDLQNSNLYTRFCLTSTSMVSQKPGACPDVIQGDVQIRKSQSSGSCDPSEIVDGMSDLQVLNTLLILEGLQLSAAEDETAGASSEEAVIKRTLENCRALVRNVQHDDSMTWTRGLRGSTEGSSLSNLIKALVKLLMGQMKEKLVVVTCLQLTYILLSKYDWRLLFATEGGVQTVLGCMQEHQSSAAVQHISLAVLKVLTGVGSCDQWGSPRRYTLNPGDAQVIKEIFSSIGPAASGSSTSLLRVIPAAIIKLQGIVGCFTSVYNGLLVIQMLTENHEALSEQLLGGELPTVLQNFIEDSDSIFKRLDVLVQKQLCDLLEKSSTDRKEVAPAQALQDMDVASLLSGLKDVRLCRELLPSLERCVCDDTSSLPCEVSQLLTGPDFFLQLLSSLEQLRGEKQLLLCIYRILNKALQLHQEDLVPWYQSIQPSISVLTMHCGQKELVQEVAHFLSSLALVNKDCAVLLRCLDMGDVLKKVIDRHGSDLQVAADLRDLVRGFEEHARVFKTISVTVLASCLQMILEQIDYQRRHQRHIRVPFLAAFLRSLGQDYQARKKKDKCWEKIEVSSNPHRAHRLTDGNQNSYWESSGGTGSHYINIFMHQGVVIQQLVLIVASEDSSYMPARVLVMGGENAFNIRTELKAVNISGSASRVVLLENATRFWPVIQVKIKRCQQGGIDTRVRGLEILGPKPSLWLVFKEQLCRRTFLFYTSRAHSWGQEICEKKERLLQLFSRLNRALSHEKEFANRFLPDAESVQELGWTCWEALIFPLVRSITKSDPHGVSPLSWLLTRYLENIQGFRQPKAQTSVFNSRVRRLTHFLVHVDTADLKPPSKTNGNGWGASSPSGRRSGSGWSSMAGIAQCCQEVVQKQVQQFLELSWNDVNLVPRFCSMYQTLRRAMDEMFGQQTQFLVPLRQGFCQGLLKLSFLTALHVTEQFARYIDRLITAIRADSSDLQSLEQLQQFLDFVLFLSDLELANSFEHFYRHYLADRLLSLGPCWLENSVADHIGICFPNQFPQQMLKNLQEAKDLQREEHLYRLQERDRGVLSEDEDEEDEEMELEESSVLQDENMEDAEVCISVLSFQCWPISCLCYLDNPSKYFPETLSTPLQNFTDFYTKSETAQASDLTQSRRLQWTWLGNAEVQYGDLTLRVSTLQMFILLLFNQHEEVTIEDIEKHTGTSGSFLMKSIDSLTSNTGIFFRHENTGSLYLHQAALRDLGSQTVLDLSIRLDDKKTSEELISRLEKRRNSLMCILDRVMKEERQIHMDRLLCKVLDGFRKEVSNTLHHDCGVPDVLSCIMRQLGNGVIHRKPSNPLILCYDVEAPPPVVLSHMASYAETVTPVPPQLSEYCSVCKISNNLAPIPEHRLSFSTFRSMKKS